MKVATIGLDIAKQVFQVHGADKMGHRVLPRKLRRNEVMRFFEELDRALSGSKPVGVHTIGRACRASWGTRFG